MIHLFAGLYDTFFRETEFSVLVIGHEAVGKTTFMEQVKYMYSPSNEALVKPTAGASSDTTTAASTSDGLASLRSQMQASVAAAAASTRERPRAVHGDVASSTSQINVAPCYQPSSSSLNVNNVGSAAPIPVPATERYLSTRRIRPTVGLNLTRITHYFSPLAAVVDTQEATTKTEVAGLPPVDLAALAESRVAEGKVLLQSVPSTAHTRLVFWDLGGQLSLRPLWENYFAQCQGLVFIVDVTALMQTARCAEAGCCRRRGDAATFLNESDTDVIKNGEGGKCHHVNGDPQRLLTHNELIREMYRTQRETLQFLLQHKALRGVPVLIACNKADVPGHLVLREMQAALDLATLAMEDVFYVMNENPSTISGGGAAPPSAETVSGTCGIGCRAMKLVEVSAVSGAGIAAGLDWLVMQLIGGARKVDPESN